MALQLHDRILDSIEAYFAISPDMVALSVDVPQPGHEPKSDRVSLRTARITAWDPTTDLPDRDAIWSQLVRLAAEKHDPWTLAAVWTMAPGLRRLCHRCRRHSRIMEPAELEAEAVAGFVTALRIADPEHPDLGTWLWWATYRHVQQAATQRRREIPVADIELVDAATATGAGHGAHDLSTAYTAPRRTTRTPVVVDCRALHTSSVEGERLGSLRYRMGLEPTLDTEPTEPRSAAA